MLQDATMERLGDAGPELATRSIRGHDRCDGADSLRRFVLAPGSPLRG